MFKYISISALLLLFLSSSSKAYIETELIQKQIGSCSIKISYLADIDPEYKTASLTAMVYNNNPSCKVTTEAFLSILGQALHIVKQREDLKPIGYIILGGMNDLPSSTIHGGILAYYQRVLPNELKKVLQSVKKYDLHDPALEPLREHLISALLTTEFFSKLMDHLERSGYILKKIDFEKFCIAELNNQRRLDAYISIYVENCTVND